MANENQVDVALVGGGIMCATLGTMLRELDPAMTIQVFERLSGPTLESSQAMNNAGTGHAANCELNYTPEQPDGTVDIKKALNINTYFEVSLQLWSYLVERGVIPSPGQFLTKVPHQSFVWGEANTRFLRARHAQLSAHPMFASMKFSQDRNEIAEWMPLVMRQREADTPIAATNVERGTDLDFGSLARQMYHSLDARGGFQMRVNQHVSGLRREGEFWILKLKDLTTGCRSEVRAKFVFLGAGGGALPLLTKSGIPEAAGYGGFPVSGQWLMCSNPEVISQHHSKVYGKPSLGAPPMSVPHLDTRIIDGEQALLFGPFAGFSTKYLKTGSYLDMIRAIGPGNIWPMMAAGWHNLDLTRYLIGQVLQSPQDRLAELRKFVPTARLEDWNLEIAGQRVQIIKGDPKLGGKLEFGTEVVAAADGSLAALLGASPGASTAATTMVYLILRCFSEQAQSEAWQARLQKILPSFGHDLTKEFDLLHAVRDRNNAVLGLTAGVAQ
jgi:malate dehydrogenase (quinone)